MGSIKKLVQPVIYHFRIVGVVRDRMTKQFQSFHRIVCRLCRLIDGVFYIHQIDPRVRIAIPIKAITQADTLPTVSGDTIQASGAAQRKIRPIPDILGSFRPLTKTHYTDSQGVSTIKSRVLLYIFVTILLQCLFQLASEECAFHNPHANIFPKTCDVTHNYKGFLRMR
jgi:hypothetical protein